MKSNTVAVRRVPRGFTLIEVLVVVAIMALLLSILLPSLSTARAQAKAVVCGTQMSELFKATLMYTHSNQDRLPYFGFYDSPSSGDEWWATQLSRYVGKQYDIYRCPVDTSPYQMPVLHKGSRIVMAQGSEPNQFNLDLTYRSACDMLENAPGGHYRARKMTSWKRPYAALLMIEASTKIASGAADPTRECFRFKDDLQYITNPTYVKSYEYLRSWKRHLGKSNFLFMDGHEVRLTPVQAAAMALKQEFYLQ
jgi:prepilin-type N-terminal cleavage/methylation domain-containing protein/prepilin-type processing-associated H-X9-DG protein